MATLSNRNDFAFRTEWVADPALRQLSPEPFHTGSTFSLLKQFQMPTVDIRMVAFVGDSNDIVALDNHGRVSFLSCPVLSRSTAGSAGRGGWFQRRHPDVVLSHTIDTGLRKARLSIFPSVVIVHNWFRADETFPKSQLHDEVEAYLASTEIDGDRRAAVRQVFGAPVSGQRRGPVEPGSSARYDFPGCPGYGEQFVVLIPGQAEPVGPVTQSIGGIASATLELAISALSADLARRVRERLAEGAQLRFGHSPRRRLLDANVSFVTVDDLEREQFTDQWYRQPTVLGKDFYWTLYADVQRRSPDGRPAWFDVEGPTKESRISVKSGITGLECLGDGSTDEFTVAANQLWRKAPRDARRVPSSVDPANSDSEGGWPDFGIAFSSDDRLMMIVDRTGRCFVFGDARQPEADWKATADSDWTRALGRAEDEAAARAAQWRKDEVQKEKERKEGEAKREEEKYAESKRQGEQKAVEEQARCPYCGSARLDIESRAPSATWTEMRAACEFDRRRVTFHFRCLVCGIGWAWEPATISSPPRPAPDVLAGALQREMLERELQRRHETAGAPATTPLLSETPRKSMEHLFIEAEEGGMMMGASALMNILGEPSAYRCRFIGRATSPSKSHIAGEQWFIKRSGTAIERLGGLDRENAQAALFTLHDELVRAGWRRIEDGAHWYSRRYERP